MAARVEFALDASNVRVPRSQNLNSADLARIEAALRETLAAAPSSADSHPKSLNAWYRTLRKIERLNGTGEWTLQWRGGPTLRARKAAIAKLARKRA